MRYTASPARPWREFYEQQAMDAAALWHLHSIAVHQPDYRPDDLSQLERRIDNRLDALMHHPALGWDVCEQALEWEQGGESFAAAMLAFRRDARAHISRALEAGFLSHDTFRGLTSALGCLPEESSSAWTQTFLASRNIDHRHLALASCEIRAQDPGEELTRLPQNDDCRVHTSLFAHCLRLGALAMRKCRVLPARLISRSPCFPSNRSGLDRHCSVFKGRILKRNPHENTSESFS